MPKWLVEVHATYRARIEVDADDYSAALKCARDRRPALDHPADTGEEVVRQLGEPWCDPEWFDLHRPGHVMLIRRAMGHKFTQVEVELLEDRLRALGLSVSDWWNGPGCDSVSFDCRGRHRIGGDVALSSEQYAALTAPRPKHVEALSEFERP